MRRTSRHTCSPPVPEAPPLHLRVVPPGAHARPLKENRTLLIDASHPYAQGSVVINLLSRLETAGGSRYQRPEQLSNLTHPLRRLRAQYVLFREIARRFGPRVLLTTGKDRLPGVPGWREKRCWREARTARGGGDSTLQRTGVRVGEIFTRVGRSALGF